MIGAFSGRVEARSSTLRLLLCLGWLSASLPRIARGADEPPPPEPPAASPAGWGEARVMGDHRFPFPQFVPSSFAATTFAVHAGAELHTVPNFPTDATTGADMAQQITLATVSANEGTEGSVRIHRSFALTFDTSGKARMGTNTATLLGTGADYELGGNAGALLRLVRTARFQLSLRGQGGYYGGQQAGVTRFYQSVRAIAQNTATRVLAGGTNVALEHARVDAALAQASAGLVTSSRGVRASAMLTAACALGRFFGLQGVLGFNFERSSYMSNEFQVSSEISTKWSETTDQQQVMVGVAADVGGAGRGVPFNFVAEYALLPLKSRQRSDRGTSQQTTLEHRLAAGVYYSGRTDLQLGLSVYSLLAQLPERGAEARASGKARDIGELFVFRYIW